MSATGGDSGAVAFGMNASAPEPHPGTLTALSLCETSCRGLVGVCPGGAARLQPLQDTADQGKPRHKHALVLYG